MRAGQIDRRISLETKTVSGRDAYGVPVEKWRILDTVFADVRFGSDGVGAGNESDVAERDVGLLNATFTIRYRSDITINTSTRVRYDGRIYNITAVAPGLGRRDRLVLTGNAENV